MNHLIAQYQQGILHNTDTWMWNISTCIYQRYSYGKFVDTLHLFCILPNMKKVKIQGAGEDHPLFVKEEHFSVIYPLFIVKTEEYP